MRILFLGGTRFLGRYAVDAALARGHAVTVFTRGRAPNPWAANPERVTVLTGDRDPLIAPGLDALREGTLGRGHRYQWLCSPRRAWTHRPRCYMNRVAQYLFVSSISVYASGGGAGQRRIRSRWAQRSTIPLTEEVVKHYGPLKAACEEEVRARSIRRLRDHRASGT